jgi:hypothetical protein
MIKSAASKVMGVGRALCLATVIAVFLAVWASPPAEAQVDPAAIIDNDVVQLGVNPEGNLGVPGGTPSSGQGVTDVGLRYMPTNAEAVTPGSIAEGWGVADDITDVSGFANVSEGVSNITPVEFTTTDTTALSVVDIGSTFRVTHDYHPSAASPNLYEVSVTIHNTSTETVDARYRRVLDWDAEPTFFEEFVTANKGTASNLLLNSNDGFETANPLDTFGVSVDPYFEGNFGDKGPADHGALFDLGFDDLGAGQSVSFNIYLGAAATEVEAEDALADVGAEAFSLAQPSTEDGPTLGTPNTFVMGFQGIGGTAITDFDGPELSSLPADVTATATSTSGAAVTYTSPTATDAVDGTVPVSCDGPASGSTFPLGTTTVSCSATDSSGNEARGSFEVNVVYSWAGVVQPINGGGTLNTFSDDTSLFKLGSTIPVKFELTGDSADVTNATASISVSRVSSSIQAGAVSEGRQPKTTPSSGSAFSYDSTSDQYVFNWSTKRLQVGTYRLSINLGDDTTNQVQVSLNKKG